MSYWNIYFLIKVGLYYTGYISFNWKLNLLFAVILIWPLQNTVGRRVRQILAWPVAIALIYYDSYLPTLARVISQTKVLSNFSAEYILELIQRTINPIALIGLIVIFIFYRLLAQWLRLSTFSLIAILSVPAVAMFKLGAVTLPSPTISESKTSSNTISAASVLADPHRQLQEFYAAENRKKLIFSSGASVPLFDIIVLHVCSLSWDDMDFVGLKDHPFFKHFDAVFTQFNSGASYSGPASLRVLHGTCGQSQHKALYEGIDPQCYVFPNLEKIGYKTSAVLNHDGTFENFAKTLEQKGGLLKKIEKNNQVPIEMHSFDGTPIYNDQALLSQWWKNRQKNGPEPVALYYNTISLHDGNRVPGMSSRSSLDTYKPRLEKLLADFDKFLTELESTGRPVVVMLMPEHGAALRGDKIQISGMREIPGPRITLVPAAIKIIGGQKPLDNQKTLLIDQPMSYFGLYSLLNNFMQKSPYDPAAPSLAERLKTPDTTQFVSENDDVIVMRDAATQGYILKSGNSAWVPYAY